MHTWLQRVSQQMGTLQGRHCGGKKANECLQLGTIQRKRKKRKTAEGNVLFFLLSKVMAPKNKATVSGTH